MKSAICNIVIILLGLAASLSATAVERIDISPESLIIDAGQRAVSILGSEEIGDEFRPSVPLLHRVYSLSNASATAGFTARVVRADTIALGFSVEDNERDETTSEGQYLIHSRPVLPASAEVYPADIMRSERHSAHGSAVISLHLFPVQYLDHSTIIFNRVIEIVTEAPVPGLVSGYPEEETFAATPMAYKGLVTSTPDGCPLGNDMVVVTSPELAEAFGPFLRLKHRTGFDAVLALTDSIIAKYPGRDDAEALRAYLADFAAAGGSYVILGGDETVVPIRYAYYYNTDTQPGIEDLMICDLYFADYDGQWDYDNDGVWGEPTHDQPDIAADIALGRLPFSRPEQVAAYTTKLETYLFDPGDGDHDYLSRSVFFTSDQMRDYFEGGQQYKVAEDFPDYFTTECERLAETPSGDAPLPTGPFTADAMSSFTDGYGFVNILAHGRPDGFVVSSNEYNLFPKTYLLTGSGNGGSNFIDLPANDKISFYYSIACSQAAFDLELLYGQTVPCVTEDLLSLNNSGAVGVIGFTRWGWVSSSYKLMAAFYRHLFSDAAGRPELAMTLSKLDFPYYRDQIYGQNYFGDPSICVYRDVPEAVAISAPQTYVAGKPLSFTVSQNGAALPDHPVTVCVGDTLYLSLVSDAAGQLIYDVPSPLSETITLTAIADDAVAASVALYPAITSDADDDDPIMPFEFELRQNYPNPFNPTTTIDFALAAAGEVSLEVFDILGRLVDRPVSGYLQAGLHSVEWLGADTDGEQLSSGIYLYRLIAAEGVVTRKMVLVR